MLAISLHPCALPHPSASTLLVCTALLPSWVHFSRFCDSHRHTVTVASAHTATLLSASPSAEPLCHSHTPCPPTLPHMPGCNFPPHDSCLVTAHQSGVSTQPLPTSNAVPDVCQTVHLGSASCTAQALVVWSMILCLCRETAWGGLADERRRDPHSPQRPAPIAMMVTFGSYGREACISLRSSVVASPWNS